MHSVLGLRKQWQKQYIVLGKTDLFNNSIGLCGNFTRDEPGRGFDYYKLFDPAHLIFPQLVLHAYLALAFPFPKDLVALFDIV